MSQRQLYRMRTCLVGVLLYGVGESSRVEALTATRRPD